MIPVVYPFVRDMRFKRVNMRKPLVEKKFISFRNDVLRF